jgi:uncharacterized membrane protein
VRAAIAYLAAGLAFAVVDAAWLTLVGPRLYRPALDPVLAERFALGPALAFYLIYVAGVLLLAILPTVRGGGDWPQAAMTGAVLGVVAYATYDLTNQATLKAWSLKITLADMLWGGFVTGLAAAAGFAAWRWADARLR